MSASQTDQRDQLAEFMVKLPPCVVGDVRNLQAAEVVAPGIVTVLAL